MAQRGKRTRTKYKNIYYNESTKKYDVKYNYTEYSVAQGKNVYKAKWVCRLDTVAEAKSRLAALRAQGVQAARPELSLGGAYELWKTKALAQRYSPVTVENTANFMAMIYRFLPADTPLKNISVEEYYRLCSNLKAAGYSEETLFSLNATFRKILNYAYKRRFLAENILSYADNLRTGKKQGYRIVTKREFEQLDAYFRAKSRRYRFLFQLLYYTGMRISEALAVTYADFEEFCCQSPPFDKAGEAAFRGMRVNITKSYISRMKLEKDTKNYKSRAIPLASAPQGLFLQLQKEHLQAGGAPEDKIFSVVYQTVGCALRKACEAVGIPGVSCHDFRHTFISNLIRKNIPLSVLERVTGDTQATILRRYSHAFESDEMMILAALEDVCGGR